MNKATMRLTPALRSGQHGPRRATSSGFSLVELLIAVALSLIVMTGLIALYGNVSRTNNEMRKTNELIENGRFAVQLLQSDLAHAGFWGGIEELEATAAPDPCLSYAGGEWPTDSTLADYKVNLMAIPVQGYVPGSDSLENCGAADDKVQANSSMLVVRHADTNTCVAGILESAGGCDGGKDGVVVGPHLQVSGCESAVDPDAELYVLDGVKASFTLRTKACDDDELAPLRKMISNIYYVGLSSDGIPNLMRVSMRNGAYSDPEPLVEGIEAFHVEYGIDSLGSNGKDISATNPGDGNPDKYVPCPAAGCDLATLQNVVAVKLHVLSRNLEPTTGYVNNTAYVLGTGDTKLSVAAFNDAYKRHVFSTTVRLVNVSSPREPAI